MSCCLLWRILYGRMENFSLISIMLDNIDHELTADFYAKFGDTKTHRIHVDA